MSVKLLTEHHLEFLSYKGGCTGLSEFTLVKMPHCWKSHYVFLFSGLEHGQHDLLSDIGETSGKCGLSSCLKGKNIFRSC